MADRVKILFLCTGNSCRSQMAEAWTRHLKGHEFEPYSAGVEPKGVDPRASQSHGRGRDRHIRAEIQIDRCIG